MSKSSTRLATRLVIWGSKDHRGILTTVYIVISVVNRAMGQHLVKHASRQSRSHSGRRARKKNLSLSRASSRQFVRLAQSKFYVARNSVNRWSRPVPLCSYLRVPRLSAREEAHAMLVKTRNGRKYRSKGGTVGRNVYIKPEAAAEVLLT